MLKWSGRQIRDEVLSRLEMRCSRLSCFSHFLGDLIERQGRETIADIAEGIGGAGMVRIFRLLCFDFSYWRGGFPDLLLWRSSPPNVKFIEVKGPRDSLSARQRAWMQELLAASLDASVCHVLEPHSTRATHLLEY